MVQLYLIMSLMVIILLIWYFDLSGNSTSCICFAFTFSRSSFCAHRRFLMGTGVVSLFWAPECCCHFGVSGFMQTPLLAQKTELVTLWFWSLWVYVGPPIFKKNSSRMLSRECSLKLVGFLGNFKFLRCHIHFFFFPGWLRGCVEVGGIKLAKHWSSHLSQYTDFDCFHSGSTQLPFDTM